MSLIIKEKLNKKVKLKAIRMNTNAPIPNGQPPFDRYNFALLVVGVPNSGKSTFVFSQLTQSPKNGEPAGIFYKKFHKVFIFSPSVHTIDKKIHVPEEQMFREFDLEALQAILDGQDEDRKDVEEHNKEVDEYNKENPKKKPKEHESVQQVLIIFDDLMSDIATDKSKTFLRMLMNRRHIGVSVIVMTQVFNRIPAKLRKGFSDVILFKTKNRKELETVREELTSYNPKEYEQLIEATLQVPHDFLLFKTSSNDMYRNLNELIIDERSDTEIELEDK
jgi:GTPase SAR1 family protein